MKRGGGLSGAVSLVMIFCVLCLAVFAVLTLATAQREKTLTDRTAQQAALYYEADRRATLLAAAVSRGEKPESVSFSGDTAAYTVPLDEDRELRVELSLGEGGVRITRWQTVYTGDWEIDDDLELFDFDDFVW